MNKCYVPKTLHEFAELLYQSFYFTARRFLQYYAEKILPAIPLSGIFKKGTLKSVFFKNTAGNNLYPGKNIL